ncbi:MAG: hypothetical protein AAFO29_12735, partial [Actinomycetota bacterium]
LYRGIMGHVEGASPAAALGLDGQGGKGRAYGASTDTNPFGDVEVAKVASTQDPAASAEPAKAPST